MARPRSGRATSKIEWQGMAKRESMMALKQQASGFQRMRRPTASRAGFTLIELLAVLTVIAILLGMILGAAMFVIKTARDRRSNATGKALEVALNVYRHEYNKWPVPSTLPPVNGVVTVSGTANAKVFSALRWNVPVGSDPDNVKHIHFLEESTLFTYLSSPSSDINGDSRQGFVPLHLMPQGSAQYPLAYMDRKGNVQYYKVTINFEDDTVAVSPPD